MKPSSLLRLCATACALPAALLVACSSSTERTPFTEEPATAPTEPPTSAPPTKAPQSSPTTTDNDAGTQTDAAVDTCKKTAPSNKCGLVPQCGCASTETCDVQDTSGNVACVAAGKAAMGAPCTTTAGCARGLTCAFGTCHSFCDNPGSKCADPKTGSCLQVKQGSTNIPNLAVCLVACDLRDANACGGTTAAGTGVCMVDDKGATDCQAGGTRTLGQTCTPDDDCGPALVCVVTGSATTGTCKKWCRVGTNDCGGSVTCGGFQTKIMVGAVEYGACP